MVGHDGLETQEARKGDSEGRADGMDVDDLEAVPAGIPDGGQGMQNRLQTFLSRRWQIDQPDTPILRHLLLGGMNVG
jgi:hypothetical protein